MRHVISLWFPNFSIDRANRRSARLGPARPGAAELMATYRTVDGRAVVDAVDYASAPGVFPGQPLAEARLAVPGLRMAEADQAADRRLLDDLADWCGRYSPWAAPAEIVNGQAGIWLDVTECASLLGGPALLVQDLLARLSAFGFTVRGALAPTPGAAWAFARFDQAAAGGLVVTPLELRARLRHLPVQALRLPQPLAFELAEFKLAKIGDLYEFARGSLVARFGTILTRRLDQALGRVTETFAPFRPVAAQRASLVFDAPIATLEAAQSSVARLLDDLMRGLDARSLGATRLELAVYRLDGAVRRLPVAAPELSRDAGVFASLLVPHLDKLGLDAGVEIMVLSATVTEPLFIDRRAPVEEMAAGGELRPSRWPDLAQISWLPALPEAAEPRVARSGQRRMPQNRIGANRAWRLAPTETSTVGGGA